MNVKETVKAQKWAVMEDFLMMCLPNPVRRLGRPLWSKLTEGASLKKKTHLNFELHLCDHCNLDCAYCTHYSPVAGESFVDTEKLEKDFARLSVLCERKIQKILLMGGEPLLHPRIIDIIYLTARYFDILPPRETTVSEGCSIVTNGILLKSQSDDFWKACAKTNTAVTISPYPITLDMHGIKEKAKEYGVMLHLTRASKTMIRIPLDPEGRQNSQKMFRMCGQKNKCINFRDGKLYTCPTIANIHHFNKYFNMNLEVSEDDYIDIYKASSMDEILSFLCGPVPFCRYCDFGRADWNLTWKHSSRELSEWL